MRDFIASMEIILKKSLIILLLIAAIAAGYLIGNTLKRPVSHVTINPAVPSQPYGYDVRVQPDSPWPTFRRDRRNSGNSPLTAIYNGATTLGFPNRQRNLFNAGH